MKTPHLIVILASSAATLAAMGCGANAPQPTHHRTPTTPSLDAANAPSRPDLAVLANAQGRSSLGHGFSCALTPKGGPPLLIYVASALLVPSGRKLLKQIEVPDGKVRVGYHQRNQLTLKQISDRIHHTEPQDTNGTGIEIGQTSSRGTACPRVQIGLVDRDDVPANVRAWADQAVRRYGTQRVRINYSTPKPGTA